ncbi:hypothetical protein [Hymenobacter defluvii]|uniref:Uncharacterized protein n=1 Tax=Hymenobacter defluvii TaxID=2054411 RepID=A0ABS3TAU5_9BACT|nr:hypothetical protein [Hymenobacter defluvii]MBO3270774.1 hypothetical protein [Hymenobacter defluvii]
MQPTVSASSPGAPGYATLKYKSLTKARVYFATPAPGTPGQCDYYSFDTSGRYEVQDPRDYGLRGLMKMIDKMGAKVARAIIYDNQAPGRPEILRKERGSWNG